MSDSPSNPGPGGERPGELRHGERQKPFAHPEGTSHLEEIEAHVERCFGKVARVFHEIVSDLVHVDVLVVEPGEGRPYYTLVTSGMSDLPMKVPQSERCSRHAEVFLHYLPKVELTKEAFADETVYWPIRKLKMLARMPHELDTFFATGHTIATDPPEPVAEGVPFCGLGLLAPLEAKARTLACADGTRIDFLQVVPLYREELEWKLGQPMGALAELFDSDSLRLVFDGRPALKGELADAREREAVARFESQIGKGGRLLVVVASTLGLWILVQVGLSLHAGVEIRWFRTGFELLILFFVARGDRWLRWLVALHCVVGCVVAGVAIAKKGLATPLQWSLLVAIPLQLLAIYVLVIQRNVRSYFEHSARVQKLVAEMAKERDSGEAKR